MENKKVLQTLSRILDKFKKEEWLAESTANIAKVSKKTVTISFEYDFKHDGSYLVLLCVDGKKTAIAVNCPPLPIFGWAIEMEVQQKLSGLEKFIRTELRRNSRSAKEEIVESAMKAIDFQ